MNSQVNLKEFLSAYLAEVDDQLRAANARLLEVDEAIRRGQSNPRAVRDLYRAVHTIKGLSAMVGVEPAVAIAHRMETILRAADASGGRLAVESVDVLLRAIRAIEHRARELADGRTASSEPASLLLELERLEPAEVRRVQEPARTIDLDPALIAKLAPFELDALVRVTSGRRAVRVDFSPSPEKAARGFSINTVRERVSSIAEIVKVLPMAVSASDDAPGALSFALLLLTSASDDDIASAVGVEARTISALTPASSAAPAEPADSVHPDSVHPVEDDVDGASDTTPHRRNIVRVDVVRLDDAMEHLSTLLVTRSRLSRCIARLAERGVDTRELATVMRENGQQLRDLRASILRVRMVPFAEVIERLPLIVRGLRRETGKQVRLHLEAGDAELDKGVAERLFPALVHLVRNAVDHAIELPAVRVQNGKPEEGAVVVRCSAQSNARLELSVSDDGMGVDREAVARRLGQPLGPGDAALLDALCRPGLSTRDNVTTTSGRGMGMDIVKRVVVDQLGGELSMRTKVGAGTVFTMHVPLTISIVDAFTLICRGQKFAAPVSAISEILDLSQSKVLSAPTRRERGGQSLGLIERRGEALPLVDLGSALALASETSPMNQALVVRRSGYATAFGLDRVLGKEEAIVRPLIDPLVQVPGVAGATDLGDGMPTLVLDLATLGARLGQGGRERAA